MYAYAKDHGPEGKMADAANFQVLEPVIVQETVVDPFTSGTVLIDILELVGIPRDRRVEPEVPMVLDIGRPSVAAG